MKSLLQLVLWLFVVSVVRAKVSDELLVRLGHGGGVTGHYVTSHTGRGILAFPNIPYAEPPVDDLRFSDPVKKAPWKGYLPSNKKAILCPRKEIYSRSQILVGEEDCLFLNVFVPQSSVEGKATRKLPVMVYIHGGSFTIGGGIMQMSNPEMILDHDVILVTANYRLGPLGFLSNYKEPLNGNWGMKDQQLMLKWVQENIHSFGGDKNQVTIFGVSAGGASVGLHMMSPGSTGLFHRAIMQSGTPYDPWVLQDKEYATSKAKKFLKLVGCDTEEENPRKLLRCLRKKSLNDIFDTIYEFFDFDMDPLIPFGPVLETSNSKTPFIREGEEKRILNNVPLLIGVTTDEGAFRSAVLNEDKEMTDKLDKNFTSIIPTVLCFSHYDTSTQSEMSEKIREFYMKQKQFKWSEDKHVYNTMLGDGLFVAGFDEFTRKHNEQNKNTFAYWFNYRGKTSFTDCLVNSKEEINWGVSHAEDMMYTFSMAKRMAPHRILSDRDVGVGMGFVQVLVDFATHSDPGHSMKGLKWNPVSNNKLNHMRIGNCNRDSCPKGKETKNRMDTDLFMERIEFWREIRKNHKPYWER